MYMLNPKPLMTMKKNKFVRSFLGLVASATLLLALQGCHCGEEDCYEPCPRPCPQIKRECPKPCPKPKCDPCYSHKHKCDPCGDYR